ncbi:MAG: carbohydrate-binding domain-containing protein [Anaerolineae bacterium]|nr:carbohydrate-binding domain-containing protein [Anaerolineae bacterium]
MLIALIGLSSLQPQVSNAQTTDVQTTLELEQNPAVDTTIALDGTTITVTGNGATVAGSVVTIDSAGTYSLSGTLTDGQVRVDTDDDGLVTLILNGVNLSSSTSAPIYVKEADTVAILLAEGTENVVSDAANYVYENAEDDEPNAAVFSDDDLTIYGSGSLSVTANYNDGITSKDTLTILSGNISVSAVDDGIRGKDYLVIDGAQITLNVQGDGLKSDNEEDVTLGYISILSGSFNITAGGDAISAQTALNISDGQFALTTAGGSTSYISDDLSAKGLKAGVSVTIDGGTLTINAADDGVHANESIVINNGSLTIASGDDGIHADASIEINGGSINITQSYEAIESAVITVNDGDIHMVSSDDGFNASDGSGGDFGGRGGGMTANGNLLLTINGGYIVMNAEGDGLDSNGSVIMNGGTVIVNGPTQSMNGPIDYNGGFQINGGLLIAVGSSGMMEAPDTSSTQYSLAVAFNTTLPAGTLIHIEDSSGNTVLTFAAAKTNQSIVLSSSELRAGETYTVYQGGTAVGTVTDGLYTDGTYSGGTVYTSLTLSSITTMEGGGMMGGGMRGGRGGGRP